MKKEKETKDKETAASISTTEVDRDYDILDELTTAIDEIEKAIQRSETEHLEETFSYVRFLLKELGDTLSGEFESLRHERFIAKKSQ